ncbi:tubulin-like doman-containing protein [Akkermansiaceae bacterium]|nr:tubulin-like doman-containing protein [Akkermansiaceae bacterium]
MKNHLFIGLGGFGGKTLAEIRKYAHLEKDRLKEDPHNAPNVDYLYVDSSEDVYNDSALWRVLGENVSLTPSDRILIRDGNITDAVNQIDQLPHFAKWTGDSESLRGRLEGQGGSDGANQRRRFGRFLFSSNATPFLTKVREKITDLGEHNECSIHIFATLAGGTGSGSLIDAITIIRNHFTDELNFPIFVYGYVTSRDEEDSDIGGFFFANQYAVLRDLNALMLGKYRPQLLSENQERPIPDRKYIEYVSLITPTNRSNVKFPPSAQVKATGQWVYQRVLATAAGQIPTDCRKAFTGEDVFSGSDAYEKNRQGERVRSNRFGTLGIKRWRIPEEEIQEALMLDYLGQVFNQAIHNRWDHKRGYITDHSDSPVGPDNILDAIAMNSPEAWSLSNEEGYRTFQQDWDAESRAVAFADNLNDSMDRLARHLQEHAHGKFRDAGVQPYFQACQAGVEQDAKKALRELNFWIDDQWKSGKIGINQLSETIQQLSATLEARGKQFTNDSELETMLPSQVIDRWSNRAAKIGWLAKLFGAETKMFKRFSRDVANSYIALTRKEAFSYAAKLADNMRSNVEQLEGSLRQTRLMLEKVLEGIKDNRGLLLDHHAMERDNDEIVFEPDHYDQFWATMRVERTNLDNLARECRARLLEDQTFSRLETLHGRSVEDVRSSLESEVGPFIQIGHANAAESNPKLAGMKLLGRKILDLFGNSKNENMRLKVESFVESAVTLAKRKKAERQPKALDPDFGSQQLPKENLLIFYPFSGGNKQAVENLKKLFGKSLVTGKDHYVDAGDPADLRCFSMDVAMPVRMLDVVHELKPHYLQKIESPNGIYFCHLDFDAQSDGSHPDLLAPTGPLAEEGSQ